MQQFAQLQGFKELMSDEDARVWLKLKEIRSAVLKAIEGLREQGVVKLGLEARVSIHLDKELGDAIQPLYAYFDETHDIEPFLKEFFIVSQVELKESAQGLQPTAVKGLLLFVEHARGVKCPRCWTWNEVHNEQGLCERCQGVLKVK